MEKIILNVEGMHCQSCETLITEELSELDGVDFAEVNHKSGIVDVTFDASKTTKMQIIETIKKEGFKVRR